MIKILFVCAGNICRSPMAEAVFRHLVTQAGLNRYFHIDSVGTEAYHVGDLAHPGTRRVLAAHRIECHIISRRVTLADLAEADYVIAMDRYNMSDLRAMARGLSLPGRLYLLLSFAKDQTRHDVPDPYYTGDFETVYRLVEAGCRGLLASILETHDISAQ